MCSNQFELDGNFNPIDQHLPPPISTLMVENHLLKTQIRDLEILVQIATDHGSLIESELQKANKQLALEIFERKQAEARLQRLLTAINQRNVDLEIILDTLREHGDAIHEQWYAKVEEAKHLAGVDSLTQIPNRRRFDEYLQEQWQRMLAQQQSLSIILCDVDCFKEYNDTYGHLLGDECLQQIAQGLQSTLTRCGDLIARYGGEEFIAVLPTTGLESAMAIALKMQSNVQQLRLPHAKSLVNPYVTLSMGVATTIPDLEQSPQNLIDTADQALYSAKQAGRNQIHNLNLVRLSN
jgi:diguanylate cyclase (GGDEF)-like protein